MISYSSTIKSYSKKSIYSATMRENCLNSYRWKNSYLIAFNVDATRVFLRYPARVLLHPLDFDMQEHLNNYDLSPPICYAFYDGKNIVGYDHLYFNYKGVENAYAPQVFLKYLESKISVDWLNQEMEKSVIERHELASWFMHGKDDVSGTYKWSRPNGKAWHALMLAYDLFTIECSRHYPPNLYQRLKMKLQFNGVRFEIFVFATLIRAGFEVTFLDERSGRLGKVVECTAFHPLFQDKLFIEAKARNVRGFLGATQGRKKNLNLYGKLSEALEKNISGPSVIFLDVNLPDLVDGNPDFEKVKSEFKKLEKYRPNCLPNVVVFTNIPFHYARDDADPGDGVFYTKIVANPKYPMNDRMISIIVDVFSRRANIPFNICDGAFYCPTD